MEPMHRVIKYVHLGFSAERVAELMDWPVERVMAIKGMGFSKPVYRCLTGKEKKRLRETNITGQRRGADGQAQNA